MHRNPYPALPKIKHTFFTTWWVITLCAGRAFFFAYSYVHPLKKYNVLNVLAEHKWLFGCLTILYPVVYGLSPVAFVRGWAFGICTPIVVIYFLITEAYHYHKVLYYVKKQLPAVYNKYQIANRIYFRSFSQADIETMLQTKVSAAFMECYKFPVKLFAAMLYFFLLYAIPAMLWARLKV